MFLKKNIIYIFILINFGYVYSQRFNNMYFEFINELSNKTLNNIKILKTLENKLLNPINESPEFSLNWYSNNFKNLFWNMNENTLYLKINNKDVNLEKILECKINNKCHLKEDINNFLKENIVQLDLLITKRLNLLQALEDSFIKYNNDLISTLNNLQKLKILESRYSKIISDGGIFEYPELSLDWYDKNYKNLFWNTYENTLYLKINHIVNINIEKLLECKIQNDCDLYQIIYNFISKYNNNTEFNKFVLNIDSIITKRIILLQN